MRQYIRHPVDVPIEVLMDGTPPCTSFHAQDIGQGGLAFWSEISVEPGTQVGIRIPHVEPAFEARARVVWCRNARRPGFELGVAFMDAQDAFLARMVEQVCYIEDYRKTVLRTEGRLLSPEDAAAEWIGKFAALFPGAAPDGGH